MTKLFAIDKKGVVDLVHYVRELRGAAERGFCDCSGKVVRKAHNGLPEVRKRNLKAADMDQCIECFFRRVTRPRTE